MAPADAVFLDAKLEAELAELDPADAAELLASVGQTESGLDQLARVGFHTLGLQTFLTAGPKESRAWTIRQGWTAPQAAGVIHTDFQRGFIKAEVVAYADLVDAGSMAEARARGQGPHRGQGLRDAGRRRGGVPLQRVVRTARRLPGRLQAALQGRDVSSERRPGRLRRRNRGVPHAHRLATVTGRDCSAPNVQVGAPGAAGLSLSVQPLRPSPSGAGGNGAYRADVQFVASR